MAMRARSAAGSTVEPGKCPPRRKAARSWSSEGLYLPVGKHGVNFLSSNSLNKHASVHGRAGSQTRNLKVSISIETLIDNFNLLIETFEFQTGPFVGENSVRKSTNNRHQVIGKQSSGQSGT